MPERNRNSISKEKRNSFLTDGKSDQICMKGRDKDRQPPQKNEKKMQAQMSFH